ncbi:MAG TPA: iron-containing alcohol dehydrogenase [Gaiellaceae bacterium]
MIVRWGLEHLPEMLAGRRAFLLATERWELPVEVAGRWSELPTHEEIDVSDADVLLALGGGSTIDTAKRVSAQTGLPLVSVPTTYSGAEWTGYFGVRDPRRKMRGGGGGANLEGVVYEPTLTLGLPRAETGGTALNALAHCAEALYVHGHNAEADEWALRGATTIDGALPRVLSDGGDLDARTDLLRGAEAAGRALAGSGLALGHAMAQALGGAYGLPHGAMNALCLPPALRFNEPAAPEAIALLGESLGTDDPAARAEKLARLGGFERLRDFGVPEADLPSVAEAASQRAGAKANPRPATAAEITELYESIW